MIQRPALTELQKQKFEEELNGIISCAPENIQKAWHQNAHISWVQDIPVFQADIVNKLPGRLADKYNSLLNRLKGRMM